MTIDDGKRLLLIKLVHTVIWMFYVAVISYVVYAGFSNTLHSFVWIAIGLVVLEGVILILNQGKCPLTPMAAKLTSERADNFDIFLPNWLAKNNKVIFSSIFIFGLLMVIYRALF